MSNGNDIFDSGPPQDTTAVSRPIDSSDDIATLDAIIAEARLVNDAADEAIGMALAACIVECDQASEECQRCINGQLDLILSNAAKVDNKIAAKVSDAVQDALSVAIGIGQASGIPIATLLGHDQIPAVPVDSTASVQTAAVDNPTVTPANAPVATSTQTGAVISPDACPAGWVAVPRPDGTVACVQTNTPLTVIDAIQSGRIRGTSPSDIQPPPTQPPPTTPPPTPPFNTPIGIGRPLQPSSVCLGGSIVPVEALQANPDNPSSRDIVPVNGLEYVETVSFDGIPNDMYRIKDGFMPAGWSVIPQDRLPLTAQGHSFPCYEVLTPTGPIPPGTGGSGCDCPPPVQPPEPVEFPRPVHPFCDPDKLRVPETVQPPDVRGGTIPDQRVTTLGEDLSTILYSPQYGDALDALTGILGTPIVAGGYAYDFIVNGVARIFGGVSSWAGDFFTNVLGGFAKIAGPMLEKGPCQSQPFTSLATVNLLPSLLNKFGDIIPSQITIPNVYAMNYLCPVLIPSGPELNQLRIKGVISDSQWLTGIRANNLCPGWQEKIVDSLQWAPSPDQAALMARRRLIDYEDFKKFARRNGVVNDADAALVFNLTEFVPGASDIVRFMLRDVEDQSVVDKYGYDSEFDQKFTGELKKWADDQGIDEKTMRRYWRAHWQILSPTQLTEALFRLRPTDRDPKDPFKSLVFTIDDVREALRINDYAPRFIDAFIATAYRPLTRVDARRAYEVGDLDKDGLKRSYLDLGYTNENADTLVGFAETTSGPIRAKRLGNPSTAEVLGWYRDNLINGELAEELLVRSGIKTDVVGRYLETESLRQVARNRKSVLSALRSRYMKGEFSDAEATDQLARAGIDPARIGTMLFNWRTIRDARYKAPTVGMLCDWWTRGFILLSEFTRRVTNLGYSIEDANRIVQSCQGKEAERRAKEAEKLAKEAESKERRRISELRRAEKEQKAAIKEAKKLAQEQAPCKPPPKPVCGANGQSPQTPEASA